MKKTLIAGAALATLILSGCASNSGGASNQLAEAEAAVVIGCTTLSSSGLLNWKSAGESTDVASLQELSDAAAETIAILSPFDPTSSDVEGMKELNDIANDVYSWLDYIDLDASEFLTTKSDLAGWAEDARSLCVGLLNE